MFALMYFDIWGHAVTCLSKKLNIFKISHTKYVEKVG